MTQPPRSQQFDDVYFSAEDGLAETRHVFVEGNGLPGRWQGRDRFCIAETGFGTGLNFLAAWKLFDETAPPGAFLDFVSVEKYPLSREEIRTGLAYWAPQLGPYLERYLSHYPLRTAGYHRVVFDGRVALTVIFDDVNDAFPQLDARVDAWFLDGFTPAKNPQMWTPGVFAEMARLSAPGATFATFTAAGDVKRGLREAGFDVRKQKGFGRKRDMLAGCMPGESAPPMRRTGRVAIVGGGLAGTSCAYVLMQYGFTAVIYERESALAARASGNRLGLYNPRFTAFRGAESGFYASAFALAHRTFAALKDIDFNPCGALHLVTDDDKQKRFPRTAQNWGWHEDHMRMVTADEASSIAGVTVEQDALYLPDSGAVSPYKLCHAYARDIDVRLNTEADPDDLDADYIIYAGGAGALSLPGFPLETVRGQVSYPVPDDALRSLKTALCYGGYLAPGAGGDYMLGSTFQRWLSDTDIKDADHADNIAKLAAAVPALAGVTVDGGRAGLRTASKDRFPVIGAWKDRIYLSTAHGSHGLLSSLMAAHYIADLMRQGPVCLPRPSVAALAPSRFAKAG